MPYDYHNDNEFPNFDEDEVRWELYYHILWATLDRQPLILPNLKPEFHSLLTVQAEVMGLTVHAINSMPDHVHLALSIPPTLSPLACITRLKASTNHAVNRLFPDAIIEWKRGYSVVTILQEELPNIIDYIQNQQKYHAIKNLKDDLEQIDDDELSMNISLN